MLDNPAFYLIAIPAVVLTGISKSGFGSVAPIAVPMMALVVSPLQAAGIMLPLLIMMDAASIYAYRRKLKFEYLSILISGLIPGAAVGIGIGWLMAEYTSENAVRLIVGVISVVFTTYIAFFRRGAKGAPPSTPKAFFWGGCAGYTSYIAHAGSPPLQVYLLPRKLPKEIYASTAVLFFTAVNLIKAPPYFLSGQLSVENLMTALVLSPCVPIGAFIGVWLNRVIPEGIFYKTIYIMAFLVGVKLIYDALTGWGYVG